MPQCKVNRNDGMFSAGLRAQEILSPADSTAFLKSLVEDFNPRCRTSDEFKRLALEFLDRWKFCCDIWDSFEYLAELDFVERQKLRTDFFENLTVKPVQSHAELRTIAENFVNNWLRTHSKQPQTIADTLIQQRCENGGSIELNDAATPVWGTFRAAILIWGSIGGVPKIC